MSKYYLFGLSGSLIILILFGFRFTQFEDIVFDLEGKSILYVSNETKDSIRIQLENWYLLPMDSQEIDTILAPADILKIDLIVQGNSYYDLTLDEIKYKIFTRPGSVEKIFVGYNNEVPQISFSGDLRKINEFLLRKANKFNSPDADWMPRVNATHSEQEFDRIIEINDSITRIHQELLSENSSKLPPWYVAFENDRLNYLNAGFKLNSLLYREKMLNIVDQVQDDFFQNTVGSLQINNERMTGNGRYFFFLHDYFFYKANNGLEGDDQLKIYKERFEIIKKELKGIVKNVYITIKLSNEIDRNRHIFDTTSISHVENEKLNEFLKRRYLSNPVLPKRSKLPYFYLMDSSEVYHSSGDFQGKILLINFWATSCKPCIKEFPSENALAEKYKDEPVAVINICMESSVDSWKRIIRKHGLKTVNLYSQGNWDKKLTKNFDINGWPHSVLVDWKGNIVQNKCPRASKNVDKLIDQLLLEMNESNDQ